MSFVRHWWRQGATSVALGLTLWLSRGTLAITDAQTVQRLGLFPSLWILIPAALLGLLAACWRSTPHRWLLILPAALLALPWLPLPDGLAAWLPASVFVWLGPMVTLVWATLAIAWLVDTGHLRRWPGLMQQLVQHPGRAPLFAAVCALAVFLAGSMCLTPWLPSGDEPHYLVITQSLLYDGDLRIENNHRAQQYRQYLDHDLRPDYLRRGADNQIYSVHAPGLPALILPAFAIGGYRGATIFLAIVAALGTALVWRVGWLVTGRADAAWIGWAAMTGSVPVFFHAFAIYPDGVASVLVLSGVLALVRTSPVTTVRAGLHGLALALLPWLHTRFAILAASLGVLILARLWHAQAQAEAQARARGAIVAAFLAMPAISAIGWFAFFYAIYGEFNPAAPYGSTMQGSWPTLPNGVLGLLIDQQFGLLPNAPIFLVALAGLVWMLWQRVHARLAVELATVIVPYALAAAAYPMWWGGWSAPARFLVPVVLIGCIPIALVWQEARTQTTRAMVGVALGLTLWLTLFMLAMHRGRIVYNDRDGYALWADWAGPVADLATGLPSLFRGTWLQALGCAAIWAIAIIAAWLVLRRIESRRVPLFSAMFATILVPLVCGVAGMIALTAVWRTSGVAVLRPDVSQLQLVQRLRDGAGAIDFGVPRLLPIAAVPDRLRLDASVARRGSSPFRPLAQQGMPSGSATVFAVNDGIYLEPGGFWLEPAIDHTLLIVSAAAPAVPLGLTLTVRNTPVDNGVTVTVGRWRRDVVLAPNEQVAIEAPAARSGRTLVQIRVAHGVRPADLDARSSDHRLLGLWVEPRTAARP